MDVQSENVPLHISKVYPNPSNDLIYLEINYTVGNAPERMLVYDIMGHELLSAPYSASVEKTVELNISNLSAGLYFVRLSGSNTDSAPLTFSVY